MDNEKIRKLLGLSPDDKITEIARFPAPKGSVKGYICTKDKRICCFDCADKDPKPFIEVFESGDHKYTCFECSIEIEPTESK